MTRPSRKTLRASGLLLGLLLSATWPTYARGHEMADMAEFSYSAPSADQEVAALEERAIVHYERDEPLESAAIFEQLWREIGTSKYLFNAGLAREAAGHDTMAILHWRRYIAQPDVGDAERSKARRRVEAARNRTRPVELRVQGAVPSEVSLRRGDGGRDPIMIHDLPDQPGQGIYTVDVSPGSWTVNVVFPEGERNLELVVAEPSAESLTLTVEATPAVVSRPVTPPPAPAVTPELILIVGPSAAVKSGATVRFIPTGPHETVESFAIGAEETRLDVGAGQYTLEVEAEGFKRYSQRLTIPRMPPLTVTLEPAPRPNEVGVALGVISGISGLGGAVMLAVPASRFSEKSETYLGAVRAPAVDEEGNRSRGALRGNLALQYVGAGLLGGSLGTAISALTTLPRRQEHVAKIEVGLGAAIATAGSIAVAVTFRGQTNDFDQDREILFCSSPENANSEGCAGFDASTSELLKKNELVARRNQVLATSAVLGFGAGLLLGGVVKLLQERRSRAHRPGLSVAVTPGSFQLNVTGRF